LKKTIALVFLFILTLSVLCSTLNVNNVKAAPEDVQVLSYSWHINPSEDISSCELIAVGEVQNIGSSNLDWIIIEGTAYTSDGVAQGAASAIVFCHYLPPQQKAPFNLYFQTDNSFTGNMSWVTDIDHIDFEISYAENTDKQSYQGLTLQNSFSYIENDTYTVKATVVNSGTEVFSDFLYVVTTFYDASGTAISLNWSAAPLVVFASLAPGEAMLFTATPTDYAYLPSDVANYSVTVQIQEQGDTTSSPTPSPSVTASPSSSPSVSPSVSPSSSASNTVQPTQSSEGQQSAISPEIIYVLLFSVIVVLLAVVALLFRKTRRSTKPATNKQPDYST
jgi:hypothetical protein